MRRDAVERPQAKWRRQAINVVTLNIPVTPSGPESSPLAPGRSRSPSEQAPGPETTNLDKWFNVRNSSVASHGLTLQYLNFRWRLSDRLESLSRPFAMRSH